MPLTYRREEQQYEIAARLRGVHTRAELMPRRRPARPTPEQPRPGQPRPGQPEKKDGDQPKRIPVPPPKPKTSPVPEKYKHLLVKKDGYANYYFNEQQQKRLKPLVDSWGDFAGFSGTWRATGKTPEGDAFKLTLAAKGLGLELAGEPYFQPLDGSDFVDEPPGSGGLLVAMHQLKLMLTQREKGFSEYYYLGSEPLDLTGDQVDVIVTSVRGVETRWYFARNPGSFVGFSSQLTEDADECEVYFATMKEFEGRFFPGEILVRVGGRDYLKLVVESFAPAATPSE